MSCILVSETWLTDDKAAPPISGYIFVGTNRASKFGGGVGIYILNGISYKERLYLSLSEGAFESVFIVSMPRKKNIIIGCIYKAPNINMSDFQEAIEQHIHVVHGENKVMFIGGDFNINLFKYDSNNNVSSFVLCRHDVGS